MLTALNLPQAQLKLSKKGEQLFVWCVSRKKKLVLTPEEWVRQHVIHFLVSSKNVPLGLIASEFGLNVNQLSRRCDIVVFGKDQKPILIVECKAPEIKIDQVVFSQIAQYNFQLNVDYLMMTNGIDHVICKVDREKKELQYLKELPEYSILFS